MSRINPIAGTLAILCVIYVCFLAIFTVRHPHAFDCSDHVICPDPVITPHQ